MNSPIYSLKSFNSLQALRIPEEDGSGYYNVFSIGDFEYVNPIKHYAQYTITSLAIMTYNMLSAKFPEISSDLIKAGARRDAIKTWEERLKKIRETEVPKEMLIAFKADSKKVQVRALKHASLDDNYQLSALIFKLWEDYGYTLSQYTAEYPHNGLDTAEMPLVVELRDDGGVNKIGPTNLTDGQLKKAIEFRRVLIAKFFDKGDRWHCLFYTFESLNGKESWNNGQPHYHYISDKFGFSREETLKQLMSRRYSLGNLPHIPMITHGNK